MMAKGLQQIQQVRTVQEHRAERALQTAVHVFTEQQRMVADCHQRLHAFRQRAARHRLRLDRLSHQVVLTSAMLLRLRHHISRLNANDTALCEALRLAEEAAQRAETEVTSARQAWRSAFGARLKMDEAVTHHTRHERQNASHSEATRNEETFLMGSRLNAIFD